MYSNTGDKVVPRCANRAKIAREVLLALAHVLSAGTFEIKGGFVRDGGYLPGGGRWAEQDDSDIDLEFKTHVPCDTFGLGDIKLKKSAEEFRNQILKKKGISGRSVYWVPSSDYNFVSPFALCRTEIEYRGTRVSIDFLYKPMYKLDFDVNSLVLGNFGPKVREDTVSLVDYDTVIKNIENKEFNVTWEKNWTPIQLGVIIERVKKMTKRGWKCLNFEEIGEYFDGGTNSLTKNSLIFTHMRNFLISEKDMDKPCPFCKEPVKKGDKTLLSSWCGHEGFHHHLCVMENWMKSHSDPNVRLGEEFFKPTCGICPGYLPSVQLF